MENRIGMIFQMDDGAFVKVCQKDALNEGCVHCHFFLPEAKPGTRCGAKLDRCYVTYVKQTGRAANGDYRAFPALAGGNHYYVPTACGTREKAVAEAEKWIAHNRRAGEVWAIEVEKA
jgi:hypothetical protein